MNKKLRLNRAIKIDYLCSFFRKDVEPGFDFEGEFHDFYEVVCVLEGSVGITSESDAFVLSEGQAIIHSPMEFHKIRAANICSKVLIFSFVGKINDELFGKIFKIDCEAASDIAGLAERTFLFNDIWADSVREGMEHEAEQFVNCLEGFMISFMKSPYAADGEMVRDESYSLIIRVLEENIDKCLKLEEIAKLCNMSCSSMKKVFSKYLGMGIIRYFSGMKMKKAVTLLKSGMTIKETAFALGYTDRNYFSYAFKKIMGKPPSEYK